MSQGQPYWGNDGDSTNAFIVSSKKQKGLFYKSLFRTLFSNLNEGRTVKTQKQAFEGNMKVMVGGSSVVHEVEVGPAGNEFRKTYAERFGGMATYGDTAVAAGQYPAYKHVRGYVNQVDSPAFQLPGRNSMLQVADVIQNPESDLNENGVRWCAEEQDYDAIYAILMGASRSLLLTNSGGTGITLPGSSTPGQMRSCYNFMTADNTAAVTPSTTQATHEANIATALDALSATADDYYSMAEHERVRNWLEDHYLERPTIAGKEYAAVCVGDPDPIRRIRARSGSTLVPSDLQYLYGIAAPRDMNNPALQAYLPFILDEILYIPYQPLKKFRPTTSGGTSLTYGPAMLSDPRTYTNTSHNALLIFMGAGALIRGTRKKLWTTTKLGDHDKGHEVAFHYDDGVARCEWEAKDGRTEMENMQSLVYASYEA